MRVKAKEQFQFITDATIGRTRGIGEEWEVSEERGKVLLAHGLVTVVPEKKEEPKVEIPQEQPKEEVPQEEPKAEPKKRGRKKKA